MKSNYFIKESSQIDENDDLLALINYFSLPKLNYIDIARTERIQQVMSRWVLLAELTE